MSWLSVDLERRTLLHEMVHFAVFLAGAREEIAHGPRFVAELRRIGALGEVWALEQTAEYEAALR
jgi:hypothetical protein